MARGRHMVRSSPLAVAVAVALVLVLAAWMASMPAWAAGGVQKCLINGTVTYQNTLCPPTEARHQPTVAELNAARQKALARARDSAASAPPAAPLPPVRETSGTSSLPATAASHRCDGRKHCSQMTSCAEATYFLKHCPGVQMDGDNDGIPCEQQWCH